MAVVECVRDRLCPVMDWRPVWSVVLPYAWSLTGTDSSPCCDPTQTWPAVKKMDNKWILDSWMDVCIFIQISMSLIHTSVKCGSGQWLNTIRLLQYLSFNKNLQKRRQNRTDPKAKFVCLLSRVYFHRSFQCELLSTDWCLQHLCVSLEAK